MRTSGAAVNDKPDAWMPLYVGDWDSGTRHLDCEQDGAYGRLVRHYWKNGALPDDDAQLARVVGMPLPRWRKMRPVIAAFFVVAEGKWTHKRVEHELAAWTERKRKAIERAAAGGRAKAASSRNKQPTSSAYGVLEGCSSSSPLEEEAPKRASSLQRRPDGRAPGVARPPVVKPIPEPDDQPSAEIVILADRTAGGAA